MKVERIDKENVYFSMDSSNGAHAGMAMSIADYKRLDNKKPEPKKEPEQAVLPEEPIEKKPKRKKKVK